MARRCVLWGAGNDYETIINQVKFEELKGNLECVAILSKTTAQFARKRDGYDVIGKEELNDIEFDYLIITAEKSFGKILEEAFAMGIPRKKVIDGRVLKIPNFDFKRYASLLEDPVTILSNDCWGGVVYKRLDLPSTSPLINIFWPPDSFCKFVQDPFFYLEQPLCMERDGSPRGDCCPIGRLGDGDRSVQLIFVHEPSFQAAKENWDRRKERVNKDRIFVKYSINGQDPKREEYLEVFSQLPYPKICLYTGETTIKNVFYPERYSWEWHHDFITYPNFMEWCRERDKYMKLVDMLKLLNGEPDYIREE